MSTLFTITLIIILIGIVIYFITKTMVFKNNIKNKEIIDNTILIFFIIVSFILIISINMLLNANHNKKTTNNLVNTAPIKDINVWLNQ